MDTGEIAYRYACEYLTKGDTSIPVLEDHPLVIVLERVINEATEELVGNADILKGEIKHLKALRAEKNVQVVELKDLLSRAMTFLNPDTPQEWSVIYDYEKTVIKKNRLDGTRSGSDSGNSQSQPQSKES